MARINDTMRGKPAFTDRLKAHLPREAMTRAANPGFKNQSAHIIRIPVSFFIAVKLSRNTAMFLRLKPMINPYILKAGWETRNQVQQTCMTPPINRFSVERFCLSRPFKAALKVC